MRYLKVILILFVFVFLQGCFESETEESHKFEKVEEAELVFDLVFPKSFWEQILAESPPTVKSEASVYELFESLPLHVKLVEEKKGVLKNVNTWLTYKEFGGKIDFSQYVSSETSGPFKLFFEFGELGENETLEKTKVYFLSWTPQNQVNGDVFGNGCNRLYDMTPYFDKTAFHQGILLHTAQQRYFNFTAGRFYFIAYTKSKIKIAQMIVTDQRMEKDLCRNRI